MATPTTSSWTNDSNGDWATAADWTNGSPDATSIDAVLGAMPNAYTVTSSANETVAGLEVDAGATLDLSGGLFTAYNSLQPFANTYLSGTIEVGAAATMTFGQLGSPVGDTALLSGPGALDIQGGIVELAAARLAIVGAQIFLSAGGKIVSAIATGELENKSGVIYGSGAIGNGTTLQLQNDLRGAIEATGAAGSALTINTGAGSIYNAGLLAADGAGGLVIDGQLNNAGVLLAATGTITLDDCLDTDIGVTQVDAGAAITLHNGVIAQRGGLHIGSATAAGGSVSTTKGDMTVTGAGLPTKGDALLGDAVNYGAIDVVDDSVLNINAYIANMTAGASLNLMASGSGVAKLVVFNNDAHVSGGVLTMSNDAGNEILSNGTSQQFGNYSLLTGSGIIGDGYLRFYNGPGGVVNANSSVGLTLIGVSEGTESASFNAALVETTGSGRLTIEGVFQNAGLLLAASAGGVTLNGGQVNSGGGRINVAAGGALLLENGSQIANQGEISIVAGGFLTIRAGSAADGIETNIYNSGTIRLNAGSTLVVDDHYVSAAKSQMSIGGTSGAATLEIASGASWDLLGSGAINLNYAGDRIIGAGTGETFTDNGVTIMGEGQIGDGTMQIYVDAGSVIDATGALILDSGASLAMGNSGMLEATKGGKLTIENAIFNAGYIIANGGTVDIESTVSRPGLCEVKAGGLLELGGQGNNDLIFATGGGTLQIDATGALNGTVWGFGTGDTLDLRGLSFVSGKMALGANCVFGTLDSELFVTNGPSTSQGFWLQGNYAAATLAKEGLGWAFASDGHGGTNVTLA